MAYLSEKSGVISILGDTGYVRLRVDTNGKATFGPSTGEGMFSYGGQYVIQVPASGDATGATDAANIQNAINSLRGVGGLVCLSGVYTVNATILLYPSIGLVGLGPLNQGSEGISVINGPASLNAPIIQIQLDPNNATWVSFPWIANIAISGSHGNTSQDGVLISDTAGTVYDVYLDHVLIFDAGGNGVNISNNGKCFIRDCYMERSQQNGIRASKGSLRVEGCYIQNNVLAGINATSSGLLMAIGNWIWSNSQQAIIIWSLTSGAIIANNAITDNGDNTHPQVLLRSMASTVLGKVKLIGNYFTDSRAGGGTASQYSIDCITDTAGVTAQIIGNSFDGNQKSGNPAIHVNASANNNLYINSNLGFNDTYGQVTNPINTTTTSCGLSGTGTAPAASTDYVVTECDQYVNLSGGTGLSITVKDPAGNTVQSGLTSAAGLYLKKGYKFNCGAFTGTVTAATFVA